MKGKAGKRALSCLISSIVFFLIFFSVMPPAFAAGKGERSFVVDNVVGDVFIQKAGGAKEVLVYPGTIFQEGDMLRTEDGSSATISSMDRDDSLVLTENTELYAATLSERNGVKQTRLQMLAGSVYAEVEPLYESADTFEIVNSEAAFSARGTHFSISIDPVTGLPTTYVYSGVVTTQSLRPTDYPALIAYPGQQINTNSNALARNAVVSQLDINQLPDQIKEEALRMLLENKERIEQENEQRRQDIINGYASQDWLAMDEDGPDPEEVDRLSRNLENLVGNIIKQALESGTVDRERMEQLIEEINNQGSSSPIDLDNVPPLEDLRGEGARQALEERERLNQQKREEQERREQQREQYEERNRELLERIQEQQRQQQEANERAAEEARNNALNRYLEQLPEADRMRFEDADRLRAEERERAQQEREQRQPSAPPPPPSRPPSGGSGGGGGSSPSPTIVEVIQPEPVKIEAGTTFTPPTQVEVMMSNGTTRNAPVQWNNAIDTSTYGYYTLTGTIAGLGREVTLEVLVYVPYGEPIELNPAKRVIPLPAGAIRFNEAYIPDGDSTLATVSQFEFTEGEREITGLVPAGAVLQFATFEVAGEGIELQFIVEDGANEDEVGIFYQQESGVWNYLPTTIENGIASATVENINGIYGVFYADQAEFPTVWPGSGLIHEPNQGMEIYYEDESISQFEGEVRYYYQTENGAWEEKGDDFTIDYPDWNGNLRAIYPNRLFSETRQFSYTFIEESTLYIGEEEGEDQMTAKIVFSGPVELEDDQLIVNGLRYDVKVYNWGDEETPRDIVSLDLIEENELLITLQGMQDVLIVSFNSVDGSEQIKEEVNSSAADDSL
ncbi:Ig-like domain-containing protein [Alkalihalobacillus oceani]|uniref:Ig-like domain-containing protein n=1 Tax=Halalkalibacter oceani TaxID=1653776 RepID=A0A9X2DSD9_9BACI|nr:Ig-like domain-containing protein [Halalkalibacter oceani]MCM3715623.1 Ig-like domain-containing protein [Halalkalibacter oceani]